MPWDVLPLEQLPVEKQEEIARAVALSSPPPKWKTFQDSTGRPMAQIPSRAWSEWYRARGMDPERLREPISQTVRERVIERDGSMCGICGELVPGDDIHIDHIVPVARGGGNEPSNLQVAHSLCNLRKGANS